MFSTGSSYLKRITSILGSLLVVSTTAVSAASKDVAASLPGGQGPIKIGFIVPLTGAAAAAGQSMVDGFNLYLDQCGNKMGGRQVKFIVENDDGNPATGVAKVHKLVKEDKVNVLSGQYLSNVCYKVAPVANSYGIPFVDCVSGADDITQRKRLKYVIRTSWTSSGPLHPFGEYVARNLHYKKVVTLVSDYAYGYEVVGGFQKSLEGNGGEVIQKLWAPLGFTDFTDIIKQIRPDADAVFMCIVGQSAKIIPKQYQQFGPHKPIIGATTSFDEAILPTVGDDLIGAISVNPWALSLASSANKHFVQSFRSKYGKDPGWGAECGFTNAMWIAKAVDAVRGNVENRDDFMAALRKVELKDAPRGELKLDPYGMVLENIYVRKVEKVNGKIQNVVVYTYPAVSQFWNWNPDEYMKQPPYDRNYPPCTHCSK